MPLPVTAVSDFSYSLFILDKVIKGAVQRKHGFIPHTPV